MGENQIQVPPDQGCLTHSELVCVWAQLEETLKPKAEIPALHIKFPLDHRWAVIFELDPIPP
jgi:hypothetical protein